MLGVAADFRSSLGFYITCKRLATGPHRLKELMLGLPQDHLRGQVAQLAFLASWPRAITCGPEGGWRKLGKETTLGLFRQQKPGRESQHAMAKGKGECQQRPPNTTPTQPTHGNTQPPQQPQQQQQQQQQQQPQQQ